MRDSFEEKTIISLFSGCGGMDLGFEGSFDVINKSVNKIIHPDWIDSKGSGNWVRLKKNKNTLIFANDIDKNAKTAWIHYFSNRGYDESIYHLESIVEVVNNHKKGISNKLPKKVDIILGGFPCQDFSVAGKRLGFNSHKSHDGKQIPINTPKIENRGRLYIWMKEVINFVKPKLFIAENVKGLVNLENVKDIIQNDFSDAGEKGYIVIKPRVLNSVNYGVPQTRQRVFFIGLLKEALKNKAIEALECDDIPPEYDPYPPITHSINLTLEDSNNLLLKPFVPVGQVLLDLPEPEYADKDLSQKFFSKARYMGSHCQGQTEINLTGPGPTIRAEHHGNIEYRRLSREHGGKIFEELVTGLIERRLTVRECARIQTFPDSFEFVIRNNEGKSNPRFLLSPSQAYKLIGNAVPPLLAYHLARRIQTLWDKYFRS